MRTRISLTKPAPNEAVIGRGEPRARRAAKAVMHKSRRLLYGLTLAASLVIATLVAPSANASNSAPPRTTDGAALIDWIASQPDLRTAEGGLTEEQIVAFRSALVSNAQVSVVAGPARKLGSETNEAGILATCWSKHSEWLWHNIWDLYRLWVDVQWCGSSKPTIITKGHSCEIWFCSWQGWDPNVFYDAGWEWRTIVKGHFALIGGGYGLPDVERCVQVRTRKNQGLYSHFANGTTAYSPLS